MNWPSASLAKGDSPSTLGKRLLRHRWGKNSISHRNSGNSDTSAQMKCGKINKAAPLSQRSTQRRGGGNPAACTVCIFPTQFTLNLDKKSQKAGLCDCRHHHQPLSARDCPVRASGAAAEGCSCPTWNWTTPGSTTVSVAPGHGPEVLHRYFGTTLPTAQALQSI